MKLFSRIFGKTLAPSPAPPPTLEERILTVGAATEEVLAQTALGQDDARVRIAAIQHLPDGTPLRRLAGLLDGPAAPALLQRAARARLAEMIDSGQLRLADLERSGSSRAGVLAVAAACRSESALSAALASIGDEATRAELATSSASSRVRQAAAQSLESPPLLHKLVRELRNKDKSVYKILKQKTDALLAEERAAADRARDALAVCELLERHGRRAVDDDYAATFEQLTVRWRALTTDVPAELTERANRAMVACGTAAESHRRAAAERSAQHDAQAAARAAAEQAAGEARVLALQAAQATAAARAEEAARLQAVADESRAVTAAERAARLAAAESAWQQIEGLVRKAGEALADGATQRAAGVRRAIEEKLFAAPPVPAPLARQVQHLDAQLRELKQWKDFAVAPKRAELIAEMEALIGSTEAPKALAERIKSLQEDWRTIGKGIVIEGPGEWERFQRASQAAYQPCRELFEKQSQEREANLLQRKDILVRLQAFDATVDGAAVDWRGVAQVLREAPQEWRRHFPVDREPGRVLQTEFDAALQHLQAKLDAWYEGNVTDKQTLVTRARHLLTLADHHEAIESVKRLQLAWQETGPAPRDKDQTLWSEFRQACDAIFQKREQANAEHAAGLEAHLANVLALCIAAERIAADESATPSAAASQAAELRTAFDALPELPRGAAGGLQSRFARAIDACQARVARQRLRDAEQSVMDLFEARRLVGAFEWTAAAGADEAEHSRLREVAEAFVTGVPHWPKKGLQAVRDALARAERRAPLNADLNELALRILCVRGEILSDTPTPAEDETLRREYQVRRLMQAMGQGESGVDSDWDALVLDWVGAGAVAPAVYEKLQARFIQGRLQRPVRAAQPTLDPNQFFTREDRASRGRDDPAGARRGRGNT